MSALGDLGDIEVRALGLAPVSPAPARCIAAIVCIVDTSVLVVVGGKVRQARPHGPLARFGGVDVLGVVEGVYNGALDAQDIHDLLVAVFLVIGGSFYVEVAYCTRQGWNGKVGWRRR